MRVGGPLKAESEPACYVVMLCVFVVMFDPALDCLTVCFSCSIAIYRGAW